MSVVITHHAYPAVINSGGVWLQGIDFYPPPPGEVANILEETPTKQVFTTTGGYTFTMTGQFYWDSNGQYHTTVDSVLMEYPDGNKWFLCEGAPFASGINEDIQLGTMNASSFGVGGETYIKMSDFSVPVDGFLALPQDQDVAMILAGDDLIQTGQGGDNVSALGGNDQVIAGGGDDVVWGGAGNDSLWGNEGDDIVFGNTGDDIIFGGKQSDILWGGQDNDVVLGNLGPDIVFANLGNDVVFGGQEADYLHGGAGNDTIYGNKGDDTLIGGFGDDRFVFGPDSGDDTIEDYEGAGDAFGDQILISSAIMDSDQEALDAVSEDVNGNAVIDLGGDNDITLVGVDSTLLTGEDFGFI